MTSDRRNALLESIRAKVGSLADRLTSRVGRSMDACRTCGKPTRSHAVGSGVQCHTCHSAGEHVVATDGGTPLDECLTLGCDNPPVNEGYCQECIDISPSSSGSDESRDSRDTTEDQHATDVSSTSEPLIESGKTASVAAAEWFHAQLDREIPDHTDEGDHPDRPTTAREYFHERGWTDSTIDEALLGYAPASRTGLLDHLMREGYDREAILGTGLFTEDLRPLWQGRYVLPYFDEDGTPVYAISRSTGSEGGGAVGYDGHPDDGMSGKYAKPAHTKDYADVEEPIFGLGSIEDGEPVLITEGIADAITAHQAGYPCISPVTTRFKHEDREALREVFEDHDAPRAYVIQDAERPSSDVDEDGSLSLTQTGEGLRGALDTAAHLSRNGVETHVAELPRPGLDKVDLDDYLREWPATLTPVLASAKPAREHPAYDRDERAMQVAAGGIERERERVPVSVSGNSEAPSGDHSALFDLDMRTVTGRSWGSRDVNPLGHHGDSENYYVLVKQYGVGYDHKHKVAYNALTHLLVEAGERKTDSPNGRLDDGEILAAWRHAKDERLIPDDDPIPRRALKHLALTNDLCESDDIEDGWKLPVAAYNGTLDIVEEEHDLDHGREHIDGGVSGVEPVPTIPFGMLSRPRDELVRYARKRGLDWPDTDEARDWLGETLRETFRDEGYQVLDAPTGLGKTHEASTTFWRDLQDVTDDQPVVLFASTTDARDEAKNMARDAGLDVKVLLGRDEACPVCAGEFDPENCDEDDDKEPVFIEGKRASAWMADKCERRGLAVSTAHSEAKELAAQGHVAHDREASEDGTGRAAVPCCPGEMKCRTETQWPGEAGWCDDDGVPRYDLIVATDPFAYVPKLRAHKNIISDELPDYTATLGVDDSASDAKHQQRIEASVTAFLDYVDAPQQTDTYGGLVHVGEHGFALSRGLGKPKKQRERELKNALYSKPARDWYLHADDAHTLAPAVAKAVYYAARDDADANGRRTATVPHEPPRLDANAGDEEGFNRTWVTVVLNDEDEIETIREAPDFSVSRSVVGLDARPNPWLWQRNVHPRMTVERVLETDERALWRRLEQGTTIIQVGDATRPPGEDGCNFTKSHADAVLGQLRAEFGDDFQHAGCASTVESRLQELMTDHGIDVDDESTMHFGEEKSRNDFADEVVGLVYGCIDPGDDYVLNLAAECDLDIEPSMHECPECDGDGCGPANDHCHDGLCRDRGREFAGPDADHGAELLASVRENHVAQMAGRFGRNLRDGQQSVVFVATDATPSGFADYEVPGVLWMAQPDQKQRDLVEYLRRHTGDPNEPVTAKAASEAVDCSKKHAIEVLRQLVEQNKATVREGAGPHGADVWRWRPGATASDTPFNHVDLSPEDVNSETITSDVWATRTWEVTMSTQNLASADEAGSVEPTGSLSGTTLGQFGGARGTDPPPGQSD